MSHVQGNCKVVNFLKFIIGNTSQWASRIINLSILDEDIIQHLKQNRYKILYIQSQGDKMHLTPCYSFFHSSIQTIGFLNTRLQSQQQWDSAQILDTRNTITMRLHSLQAYALVSTNSLFIPNLKVW
jgi:hypothetical protein